MGKGSYGARFCDWSLLTPFAVTMSYIILVYYQKTEGVSNRYRKGLEMQMK